MNKPSIKRIAIVASTATLAVAGLAVVSMPSSQALTHTQLTSGNGQGSYTSTTSNNVGGANVPRPSSPPALSYQHGICTLGGKVVSVTHCTTAVVPASQVEAFVRHEVASYHVAWPFSQAMYSYIMLTNFPSLAHSTY